MATNIFKNYTADAVGTTAVTVYTVPTATTAVIIGANLANRLASQINVSVQLGTTYIIKDVPIPAGSTLSILDGKIIAEAADTITVTSSDLSSADVIISVLEQS